MSPWRAWGWDWTTAAWLAWIAVFVVLESYTLVQGRGEELTAHLRPVFLEHPLTWFVTAGVWLWLGVHFLWPAGEKLLQRIVSTY